MQMLLVWQKLPCDLVKRGDSKRPLVPQAKICSWYNKAVHVLTEIEADAALVT
jgi:hypothetical protein